MLYLISSCFLLYVLYYSYLERNKNFIRDRIGENTITSTPLYGFFSKYVHFEQYSPLIFKETIQNCNDYSDSKYALNSWYSMIYSLPIEMKDELRISLEELQEIIENGTYPKTLDTVHPLDYYI